MQNYIVIAINSYYSWMGHKSEDSLLFYLTLNGEDIATHFPLNSDKNKRMSHSTGNNIYNNNIRLTELKRLNPRQVGKYIH